MKNLVIMFVKEPILGSVKTRLAKQTSDEFALGLYKVFVQDLLQTLEPFELCLYAYPTIKSYDYHKVYQQQGQTLGDKMYHAFEEQFSKGYENIVLIGSDTPHISKSVIQKSFIKLKEKNVVIGPSLDGGYYLIALNKKGLNRSLFENITWSSEWVFEQTLQKVNNNELYLLEYLNDIDTLEDLKHFYKEYKKEFSMSYTMLYLKDNFNETV